MSSIKVKSDTIVNFFKGKGAGYSKECTKASKKARTCTRRQPNLNTAGLLLFQEKKVNSSKCSFVCLPTATVLFQTENCSGYEVASSFCGPCDGPDCFSNLWLQGSHVAF
jgi:hypothetical protein